MSAMDIVQKDIYCPRCHLPASEPTRLSQRPSPFSQYLGTTFSQYDQVPHDAHSRLSTFIGDISADIQTIDNEIKAIEAAAQRLRNQRQEAEIFLYAHQGLLCRAHDLPNEVLCQIFLACLRPGGRYSLYGRKHLSERSAPWNIIAVCRRWRQVGCDFSRLWTGPSFKLRSSHEMELGLDTRGRPNRITTTLTRAKNEPLTLDVDLDSKDPNDCLSGLGDFFPRVENLYLRGHPGRYRVYEGAENNNDFPNLRKLSLTMSIDEIDAVRLPDDVPNTVYWDRLLAIIQSCPPLQELELLLDIDDNVLRASDIHLQIDSLGFPLTELKTLTLQTGSLRCTARLLRHCASITELDLRSCRVSDSATIRRPIFLPNLHTLRLDGAEKVSSHLKCPALRHVINTGRQGIRIRRLHNTLVLSGCALESLDLVIDNYYSRKQCPSDSDWDALLPLLAGLRTLTLRVSDQEDLETLSTLTRPNVFPSLETLNLRYKADFHSLAAPYKKDADIVIERFLEVCVHKVAGPRLRRLVVMFESRRGAAMNKYLTSPDGPSPYKPPFRESTLLARLRSWKAEGIWVCVGQHDTQYGEDTDEVLPSVQRTGVVQYEAIV
ncbi:hypothetical protein CYLTODRAFT_140940 [Cylindrobasidium torrendii FP15055 ss-10]|uniref:F-box domain-containing protein n=1 Tax=Cylindrobasidium torrendii FP15055 ss-10 TaxID=1314674 RepID=A0A0D7AYS9_9AGAR|nr:hypothetical protein CYLTODRAFT_140940 [Cylindrobasidium torrendii FP15055 ss-10]